jgi:hypothetical protein
LWINDAIISERIKQEKKGGWQRQIDGLSDSFYGGKKEFFFSIM